MIGEVDIGVKDRMVDIVITLQYCIQYFRGCREKISSYVSGLNFFHWKASLSSNEVAEFHAMMKHMEFQSGNTLTRWCKGLYAILKNIYGNINMDKQRAILLIEADFNFGKKL